MTGSYSSSVEPAGIDIAILNGTGGFAEVDDAGTSAGAPVAAVTYGEVAAVMWLSRCKSCNDGTVAVDINVYRRHGSRWVSDGGGGGGWTWPVGDVPEKDTDGAFEFGLRLPDGQPLRLFPRYGPSGPVLRAEPGEPTWL